MTAAVHEPATRTPVAWATVPKVNLLPPEVIEGRRFRRTKVHLGATVLAAVLAGLGATAWASYQVGQAEDEKALVDARRVQLTAEVAGYSEVPRVLAELDSAGAAREQAMATDVLWYRFLDELALATPATVSLTGLDLSVNTDGAVTGSDPLADISYGEVTVDGKTTQMPEVAAWLTSVSALHGLDVTRLQTATRAEESAEDGEPISFTSAVGITTDALSHRYDRKAG